MLKNLFKKTTKETNSGMTVSQKAEYYKTSIVPKLREEWTDKELCALTGIDDLFAPNVTVKKELSREELFECYRRAYNMGQTPLKLIPKAKEAVERYIASNEKMKKQYADFMRKGNETSTFQYQDDMFVLDILRQSLPEIEIKDDVETYKSATESLSDAELLSKVNGAIQGFVIGEGLLADTMLMSVDFALMENRLNDLVKSR